MHIQVNIENKLRKEIENLLEKSNRVCVENIGTFDKKPSKTRVNRVLLRQQSGFLPLQVARLRAAILYLMVCFHPRAYLFLCRETEQKREREEKRVREREREGKAKENLIKMKFV